MRRNDVTAQHLKSFILDLGSLASKLSSILSVLPVVLNINHGYSLS